jgi:hypothetical protein
MGEFCLLYLLCMLPFPVPQTLYKHRFPKPLAITEPVPELGVQILNKKVGAAATGFYDKICQHTCAIMKELMP